ncbi:MULTISPECIES: Gfo/Idh/MocA family oxidoreductase [Rhizobium]|uniref:Gfo/Idh/MocA family oxidoreductase n=1 Tax=Rhizobium tropici TaxID=398 RepID=A0A329Y650_RHITR|nr:MULTISPECIES: Gfo/Idh/MocA family oxidoreductase [Rhizobium]RAX37312.1 gfo/Idh/MocA family oxidoreductase [Rhizobium tropici]
MNNLGEYAHRNVAQGLRLGFLGVGRIGRHRMKAILDTGLVGSTLICDPSAEMAKAAADLAEQATIVPSFDDLLSERLDGIVIATPSALHAEQAMTALEQGIAVFCQKPLGRTRNEVEQAIAAARKADRLLQVDLSYRHTRAMRRVRDLVRGGELGKIFAVDMIFHNAYGPDKPWFYDRRMSGGGCVMDLGIHLADLALWTLDFPAVTSVQSCLMRRGVPIQPDSADVEDFALATVTLSDGAALRLACSWGLNAGVDAVISANFHGTAGGAAMRNVNGSFYDFVAEGYRGTRTDILIEPPDEWGGRAAAAWATRLAGDNSYDPLCERLVDSAAIIDAIYGG